ncbi:hypothetical protein CWI38_0014p0080 [Hamiltosporidium tvaerminnensis]|uniref:Uncharacterized protein n=1 Tax=Hamiltosporidium tvaerminnensis TaxID=1176355 RepID=A0A4V2JYF0_9MICR|nr:hypothetical protein CWI38_0014p0080 [Hamiltosporidium tvaerminnensis]
MTLLTIFFARRRGLESYTRVSLHFLKQPNFEENGSIYFKAKNNISIASDEGNTLEEPTKNINEDSDLEQEKIVV